MSDIEPLVTITRGVERIVTVKQGVGSVELRQALPPRISVLTVGVQGPVGSLAENVLQRALLAEVNAKEALSIATESEAALSALLNDLKASFTYHAGVISAQGG